jgi:uncharacterized protein YndB with AHSA1/START domain
MNNSTPSIKSIKLELSVQVPISEAFWGFITEINSWWPQEYTWAGNKLIKIAIEPKLNGRCYEIGPHGFQCDWGRVLVWEPPKRILFTWQIAPDRVPEPDPEKVSEIEILFKEEKGKTNVTFLHSKFEKHGEKAEFYRNSLSSSKGWPYILNCYSDRFTPTD